MNTYAKQFVRTSVWITIVALAWAVWKGVAWAQAIPPMSVPIDPGTVDLKTLISVIGTVGQPGLLAVVMVLAIRWLLAELARREAKVDAVVAASSAAATAHEARMVLRDAAHEVVLKESATAMQRVADVISRCPANGVPAVRDREERPTIASALAERKP